MPVQMPALRPYLDCPLAVAYGLGVDSTAMLVEFAHRGIRPDLILFADTGNRRRLHVKPAKKPKPFAPTVRAVREIVPNKLIPKLKPTPCRPPLH